MSLWGASYPVRVNVAFGSWRRPVGARSRLSRWAAEYAQQYGYTLAQFTSAAKTLPLAHVRQAFMAEAYATRRYSLTEIGRALNRDHSTILHGIRAFKRRQDEEERYLVHGVNLPLSTGWTIPVGVNVSPRPLIHRGD